MPMSQQDVDAVIDRERSRRRGDSLPGFEMKADTKGLWMKVRRQPGIALVLAALGLGGGAMAKDKVPMPALVTSEWVAQADKGLAEVPRLGVRVEGLETSARCFYIDTFEQWEWQAKDAKDTRRADSWRRKREALERSGPPCR